MNLKIPFPAVRLPEKGIDVGKSAGAVALATRSAVWGKIGRDFRQVALPSDHLAPPSILAARSLGQDSSIIL